jgi:hypothetical protein
MCHESRPFIRRDSDRHFAVAAQQKCAFFINFVLKLRDEILQRSIADYAIAAPLWII